MLRQWLLAQLHLHVLGGLDVGLLLLLLLLHWWCLWLLPYLHLHVRRRWLVE